MARRDSGDNIYGGGGIRCGLYVGKEGTADNRGI